MLAWFQENAPIKRKLAIAFGSMSLITAVSLYCGWWVAAHSAASSSATSNAWVEMGIASVTLMAVSLLLGRIYNQDHSDALRDDRCAHGGSGRW